VNSTSLENRITESVIGAAIEVHKELGPGLLEAINESPMEYELLQRRHKVERRKSLPVLYQGVDLGDAYRLDLVVDGLLIVELKTVEHIDPVHEAQLLTYLQLTRIRLGLLINFHVPVLRLGVRRLIHDPPVKKP
jgi:GxxExxY protein